MITAYDDNPEPILDPTFGELIIRYESWGNNPDGTFYYDEIDLDTHYCTEEELGLVDSSSGEPSRFLTIRPSLLPQLDIYKKKLRCTDKTDLMIKGDYNSNIA